MFSIKVSILKIIDNALEIHLQNMLWEYFCQGMERNLTNIFITGTKRCLEIWFSFLCHFSDQDLESTNQLVEWPQNFIHARGKCGRWFLKMKPNTSYTSAYLESPFYPLHHEILLLKVFLSRRQEREDPIQCIILTPIHDHLKIGKICLNFY